MPACQPSSGTRVTASSRGASGAGGWVARAAAAASSIGLEPLILVVLRVATSGKPSTPDGSLLRVVGGDRDRHLARLAVAASAEGLTTMTQRDQGDQQDRAAGDEDAAVLPCEHVEAQPVERVLERAGEAHGGERYPNRAARPGLVRFGGKWKVPLPIPVNWLTDQSISL